MTLLMETSERAAIERENLADAINPHSPNALSDEEIAYLANCLLVIRHYESDNRTPVEGGIISIGLHYYLSVLQGFAMTPDDIVECVDGPDGCRTWFDDAVSVTREFNRRYPKLIAEAATEKAEEE